MEQILIYSWIALSLAGIVIWISGKARLQSFLSYLLILLLLQFSFSGFGDQPLAQKLMATMAGLLTLNWILSRVLYQKWRQLSGIVSVGAFVFWKGVSLTYYDYPIVFDAKNALFLPLAGAAFPLLIGFKSAFLGKFFGIKPETMYRNLQLMGLGILVLASLFFAGIYGLVLSAVGYYVSEVYRNKDFQAGTIGLMLTALALILVKKYEITTEAFLHGSTLVGLFVGLGLGLWIKSSEEMENKASAFKKILYFAIPLLLVLVFMQIETLKEHTGGVSAFTAMLLALALSAQWMKAQNERFYLASLVTIVTLGLWLTPQFTPQMPAANKALNDKFAAIVESEEETETPSDSIVPLRKDSLPVQNPWIGKWKIRSEASSLEFELGPPETRTKGFFQSVKGNFDFDSIASKSSAKVELPLSGFTTQNTYRDESLFSAEYLDATAFPTLVFQSVKWTQRGKKITLSGDFTMKGIKQRLSIQVKIVATGKDKKGEYLLLSGLSSLDRTKFGMSSDPKIGDIVDFNFKLELRR